MRVNAAQSVQWKTCVCACVCVSVWVCVWVCVCVCVWVCACVCVCVNRASVSVSVSVVSVCLQSQGLTYGPGFYSWLHKRKDDSQWTLPGALFDKPAFINTLPRTSTNTAISLFDSMTLSPFFRLSLLTSRSGDSFLHFPFLPSPSLQWLCQHLIGFGCPFCLTTVHHKIICCKFHDGLNWKLFALHCFISLNWVCTKSIIYDYFIIHCLCIVIKHPLYIRLQRQITFLSES